MGGNDAFIVLKDANLEWAVDCAYRSRILNAGQACNGAKRFIITAPVYDRFKEMLIEKIKKNTVIGDPMDRSVNLGPLVTERQLEILQYQIGQALGEGGGRHLYGDFDLKKNRPNLEAGNYSDVHVLEGINPDSNIYTEEFFGPVFNLFKVGDSK